MLEIEGLRFAYSGGQDLFDGLTLRLEPGRVMAIVGRNGAGKSTLLRLLNGLLRPVSGRIRVAGQDISGLAVHQIARHVGTMYQSPGQQLFAASCRDEVAFGPRCFGTAAADLAPVVDAALARCGLETAGDVHPLDLDQAAQRFLTLASVLATAPRLLLLDEPQRGLDRQGRARLAGIIREEAAAGRSVVLICHDMDFVDANATSILSLGKEAGRPEAEHLPATSFFADPARLARTGMVRPWRLRIADLLAETAAGRSKLRPDGA